MRRHRPLISEKWLILGLLLALVPLFQNMSPTHEDDRIDMRVIAPVRPSGDWDSPYARYFPKDLHPSDLADVGQDMLSHNFDPMLKELELTYFPKESESASARSLASIDDASVETEKESTHWKLGLINPTKMRLMYSNPRLAQGFQLSCEAETGHSGLSFKMSHPLNQKMNLGITHETAQRQSQIQVDYRW